MVELFSLGAFECAHAFHHSTDSHARQLHCVDGVGLARKSASTVASPCSYLWLGSFFPLGAVVDGVFAHKIQRFHGWRYFASNFSRRLNSLTVSFGRLVLATHHRIIGPQ